MRCFISIELPEDIKNELGKIQAEISKISDVKMRMVEEDNLHLTLKFLGEITDFQINQIKEILKELNFKKFNASLNSVGIFPSPSFIRVIWIGLEPSFMIKEMHARIDEEIAKLKLKRDYQFESHITLARVKFVKDKEKLVGRLKDIKVPALSFDVDSISLKKSTLARQGPIYEDIVKVGLL
jgi:2'-5' RNA ligase